MAFAVNEINKNPHLLPSITLGYHLYDNCVRLGIAFRAAISLASGTEESFSNLNCTGPPPVIGIVGDPSSTPSIAISNVLGLFRVPIVSCYEKKRKENTLCIFLHFFSNVLVSEKKSKALMIITLFLCLMSFFLMSFLTN